MIVLTLNAGSNSLKFEVVATEEKRTDSAFGESLLSGAIDDIGKKSCTFRLLDGKKERRREAVSLSDHGAAATWVLNWIGAGNAKAEGVTGLKSIDRVGHRVVHGGNLLTRPARITDEVVTQISSLKELAPLHTDSVLQVIRMSASRFDVPMIAVIDSAFHHNLPDQAALYPLPPEVASRHGIRRYGFHGISHQYLTSRYAEIAERSPMDLKLVTLHLEGGSSVAAIERGKSVDTSMGMTPLEGLMMGSRCGDIDPSLVLFLMRKEGWDGGRVEQFLNKECGIKGVSGLSADTRELQGHLNEPKVKLAWDMFCYRVSKYIGAYLAVLRGADAIVFGGGIGENTPLMRQQICDHLGWCGALLDAGANDRCVDAEARISTKDAKIPIWVIPTQEGLMMAKEVASWS